MVAKPKPVKAKKIKKKKSPSERKKLVKQLDDIVSLIVRKRDAKCVTPGNCHGFLTASHYYKRENWGIRWSLVNVNAQCSSMNFSHSRFSEIPYAQYMRKRYGDAVFSMLLREEEEYRARDTKWTVPELREKFAEFTRIYEEMI